MNAIRFAAMSTAPASRRPASTLIAGSVAVAVVGSGALFISTRLSAGRVAWAGIRSRVQRCVAIVSIDEPLPFSCTLD